MVIQHRITTHREGSMVRLVLILSVLLLFVASPVLAEVNSHGHAQSPFQPKAITTVTLQGNALVLTFGPIDLPAGHSGDLASSLPIHSFKAPKDMTVTGFRSRIFTKDGKELPGQYLHHILLQNLEEKSLSDRKSTRLNSSHGYISYAVFCLKKKKKPEARRIL